MSERFEPRRTVMHKEHKAQSGLIKREDSILVIAYDHQVVSPRDASSGLPNAKRQHGLLKITKEIDKSTPLLMSAWSTL